MIFKVLDNLSHSMILLYESMISILEKWVKIKILKKKKIRVIFKENTLGKKKFLFYQCKHKQQNQSRLQSNNSSFAMSYPETVVK